MLTALSSSHSSTGPSPPVMMPLACLQLLLRERPPDYVLSGRNSPPPTGVTGAPPLPDLIDLYFEDAFWKANPELLSHREEIELSQTIESGRLAAIELEARPCDSGRVDVLRQLTRRGDEARHRLITANLRLVVTVASWYRSPDLPLPDLIQEGNIGLMQAVDKYDWRRGTRFSTCAVWWIRQAITRSLANDRRLIRVPVHIHHQLARIARAQSALYHRFGREPSPCEIAEVLGLSEKQVRDCLPYMHGPIPLDTLSQPDDGRSPRPVQTTGGPDMPSTEGHACQRIADEVLYEAIEELPPQEQRFLECRFGLRGRETRSLRAAGEALGISKGQAQTLEARALAKLRSPSLAR